VTVIDEDKEPPASRSGITPADVQQKQFRTARFGGGYRMREVDEFLDQITEAMSALLAENERLRAAGSTTSSQTPKPAPASTSATRPADRAAIQEFLLTEKGFLQSLGSLVQGHAEELKDMVRATRSGTVEAPAATAPERPELHEERPAPEADIVAERVADSPPVSEGEDAAGMAAEASDPPTTVAETEAPVPEDAAAPPAVGEDEEPIRLDEPQPARSRRGDETEGSLRDLFWGEE
jgi:DivIVA domain-containing protein